MEDIDVICFVYIYGGYRCILFVYIYGGISFMEDIDVIRFVYIMEDRCNSFCLHLWRMSM